MTNLINSLQQKDSLTANNAVTNSTSLNPVVDMFFLAGASRNMSKDEIIKVFLKAYIIDRQLAVKCLFWARDIRGGAGERHFFRSIMSYLRNNYYDIYNQLVILIPEYGYWKDYFIIDEPNKESLDFLSHQLDESENRGLLAKWFPRKGKWFTNMHNYLNITPKEFRKKLVLMTNVVETKMCNKEWDKIEYSKIPSKAFSKYKNAYLRNDKDRFVKFLEDVAEGKDKINAGAIFPYELYRAWKKGDNEGIREQWSNLPDYITKANKFLPVCDVSGSMYSNNELPLEISVSLGIYLSERNKSSFKDAFITFSPYPQLEYLKGDVVEKFRQLQNANWGGNTNLLKTFELVLNRAMEDELPPEDMPETILIISDMEFDAANGSNTNLEEIKEMYANTPYNVPNLAFWNVNGRANNVPGNINDEIALISGASPSIVKSVLEGDDFTPTGIMLKTLNSDRYKNIRVD